MNKTEIQNRIYTLEKELQKLKEEIKEIDKYPELGTKYYRIENGLIFDVSWDDSEYDRYNYDTNNYYPFDKYSYQDVKKEKEKIIQKARIERIMKKYARPFKENMENWSFYYDFSINGFEFDCYEDSVLSTYCFASKEIGQKVIELCGEDNLKKYWFRIEE